VIDEPPPPDPVASPPVGRGPGYVPGQRKARHRRWTRLTTALSTAGLVSFAVFAALAFPRLCSRPSLVESQVAGCRDFLAGVAGEVRLFAAARRRLPKTLAELRDPDLPSAYDAEPWDVWHKPIEYRILDEATSAFELRSFGPDMRPDTADDVVWPPGTRWK
jgi:hypothetical protein